MGFEPTNSFFYFFTGSNLITRLSEIRTRCHKLTHFYLPFVVVIVAYQDLHIGGLTMGNISIVTGGYIPFGYCVTGNRKTGRKVQINEDQAVIVRKIFEDYAAGRLVTDIIDELHEKGIENRGQPFARNTV